MFEEVEHRGAKIQMNTSGFKTKRWNDAQMYNRGYKISHSHDSIPVDDRNKRQKPSLCEKE